jgi:hypothetical protein
MNSDFLLSILPKPFAITRKLCGESPHETLDQEPLPRPTLGILAKNASGNAKEDMCVRNRNGAVAPTATEVAPAVHSTIIAIITLCASLLALLPKLRVLEFHPTQKQNFRRYYPQQSTKQNQKPIQANTATLSPKLKKMKMSIQANTTILPPKEKKNANAHSKKKEPSPHPSKQANTATFSNKIHLMRNEGNHTLCFFSVFGANKNL